MSLLKRTWRRLRIRRERTLRTAWGLPLNHPELMSRTAREIRRDGPLLCRVAAELEASGIDARQILGEPGEKP